jgi:hypothetical protein
MAPEIIAKGAIKLPPPAILRERLALAMRDVDILAGLLKLSERVTRRDGHTTKTPTSPTPVATPQTR